MKRKLISFSWGVGSMAFRGKTLILLLAMLSFPPGEVVAGAKKTYGSVLATIVEVHDGDTVKVDVESWPSLIGQGIGVRVYGIDTRELKTGATKARDRVKRLLPVGSRAWLVDLRRDKYFRILADVGYDCGNWKDPSTCDLLSATLIEEKLAVPYFGEKKKEFPGDIK